MTLTLTTADLLTIHATAPGAAVEIANTQDSAGMFPWTVAFDNVTCRGRADTRGQAIEAVRAIMRERGKV